MTCLTLFFLRTALLKDASAAEKTDLKEGGGTFLGVDVWDAVVALAVVLHLAAAPFTKVEESFNVQACHDVLFHGADLAAYDHHEFPGVVPRTFIGALALSALSAPLSLAARALAASKIPSLLAVRAAMGLLVVYAFGRFRREVARRFGRDTAAILAVVTASQFHFAFYASRTLPNTFALVLVMLAYTKWSQERFRSAIGLLVFVIAVFRSDVVLLAAPMFVEPLLLRRSLSFASAVMWGLVFAALSVGATVAVDTVMWGRPIWPEAEVFYFNTVLNKSHEWGVMPWHWYFSSALPRMMAFTLPLAALGLWLEGRRALSFVLPSVAFVVLYSFLPHKENRFIIYAVPVLNVACALALAHAARRAEKSWFYTLVAVGGSLAVALTLAATFCFLAASASNYPGGYALAQLHSSESASAAPAGGWSVHIDVPAAQTGVSRFGEAPGWTYSKQEGQVDLSQFTHLVHAEEHVDGFRMVDATSSFKGVSLSREFPFVSVRMEPTIFVHRRKEHHRGRATCNTRPASPLINRLS
eukprot:m51a1_g10537 putative dol-p-man:man c -pp-dol alpha- -mannosyltransferase-like (528) ;mRNA; f:37-1873